MARKPDKAKEGVTMFYINYMLNRDMAVGRHGYILSVGRSLSPHRTGLVIVGESHSGYHFFVASAW